MIMHILWHYMLELGNFLLGFRENYNEEIVLSFKGDFGLLNNVEKLWHLNTWCPGGGTFWGGVSGGALQEEVCHWRWAFILKAYSPFQFVFCFLLMFEDMGTQLPDAAAMASA